MNQIVHSGFTEASVNGADRRRQLTLAAQLLADGHYVEPQWMRVQLLDLRDLVEALGLEVRP
ncbi:hypothetical protein SAMN06265360_107191 [Haloechinothrix alba]|uniref:Uncharacterized protein n=1 Tax=Haloechinothrix alba TaxID=664784 RepID=A0A238WTH5_9PSEU|nr:hypothetical protein [Haloechinothrix alba]SNR49703.1 hypothetical protein SAMN06265360_107191 [Haloechinothrix alba]